MPSITDASEPSLSIELTVGTSLYYTVSKRRRGRRREKGENEIRREGRRRRRGQMCTWATAAVSILWCFRFEGEMASYPG